MRNRFQRQDCLAINGAVESRKQLFGMSEEKIDELGFVEARTA